MSGLDPEAVAHWRSWIGRTRTRTEVLDPEALRRFAAASGARLEVEHIHTPLGHWAFFLPVVAADALGAEGHAVRGDFLPPVDLPRRMFAASAMRFHEPLQLGAVAEQTSTVARVEHRTGRSGDLVFVDVEHEISQGGALCISERQVVVYWGAGERLAAVQPRPVEVRPQQQAWTPGPVELFRFSAATFNGHRIHYDHPYTVEVEGYPGLVVHGPLTAVKLCGYAEQQARRPASAFAFRAVAPLFVSQPVTLGPGQGEGAVSAVRCDGAVAMIAEAEF